MLPPPPSPFHSKALWTAITAISVTLTMGIVVGFIYLGTQIIAFLQPILIPFAVAGVLAYLLEPAVKWLEHHRYSRMSRHRAVAVVFVVALCGIVGISFLVLPALAKQGGEFADVVPAYAKRAKDNVAAFTTKWHDRLKKDYGIELFELVGTKPASTTQPSPEAAPLPKPLELPVEATPSADGPPAPQVKSAEPASLMNSNFDLNDLLTGAWLQNLVSNLAPATWAVVRQSLGGFLGVFGFLLSFVIVPLYLYYFLTESTQIATQWSDYIPLRASRFKDEVVGTLTEINGYLIAFFRGQLVVSLINGVATAIGLTVVGLKFGWLIGVGLCILGMIPYLGILVCMIPAVIIASVQGGSWLISPDWPWWVFPVVVLGIFAVVQQIDGLFITPKIVGESVGLHPMTVIVSVFVWSLIMGGLLGAILAVPMTACIKVLFQRYIWQARIVGQGGMLAEAGAAHGES